MLSFQLNEIITPIALGLHVSDTIFFHTTVKTYKMGPDFLHFLFFNHIILLEYSRFHELEHLHLLFPSSLLLKSWFAINTALYIIQADPV